MYSEQLEKLIEASLMDGELSEKEKRVLFKRAETEGVDLDEFEILLDAQLMKAKKTKEVKQTQQTQQPQQAQENLKPSRKKIGNVLLCPACGASVQGGVAVCPECGHVFNNVEANLSVTKLDERLSEIQKEYRRRQSEYAKKKHDFRDDEDPEAECDSEMAKTILSFPVPNSRADLLEFLPYMKTRAEVSGDAYTEETRKACRAKYKECILKAQVSFGNDPAFQVYLRKPSTWERFVDYAKNSEFFLPLVLCVGGLIILIAMGFVLDMF